MPVCGSPDNLYVGRMYESSEGNLRQTLRSASDAKFDFVVYDLCKRQAPEDFDAVGKYELRPSTISDLALDSKTWSSAVVGTLSPWIDLDAATTSERRELCYQALEEELHWASHLGVYGILLPPPTTARCELYAGSIDRLVLSCPYSTQLMLRIPLALGADCDIDGWEVWNSFRILCDQHSRLQVALELTADLPGSDRELERWFAEPVRAVIVPADVFLTNKQGLPTLSKRHKAFLLRMFKHRVQIILSGLPESGPDVETEVEKHLNMIARLFQSLPPMTPLEQFELPYHDYLQAPLQPLQDDLESQTYETFEKDPVKYVQYEEALYRCLKRKVADGKEAPLAVMVLGAGRGPLVAAARSAAGRAEVEVVVWAVEKNPNALLTLKHRKQMDGWTNVDIVGEDMRFWNAPRQADIIVSELLGSFGDNELSPECLDGAQRFLASDGTCIPCKYTSYLTPVTSPKLWNDVKNYSDLAHFETAYVVKFHKAFYPCSEIPSCFTFEHPNWEKTNNDRYAEVDFTIEVNALVHGFAGYFHCDLYEDCAISIQPETLSEGMFSWFPIFFPLRQPVNVRRGQRLKSHWWRRQNDKKVWYEWATSEPNPQPIHNPSGRSYYIGK